MYIRLFIYIYIHLYIFVDITTTVTEKDLLQISVEFKLDFGAWSKQFIIFWKCFPLPSKYASFGKYSTHDIVNVVIVVSVKRD